MSESRAGGLEPTSIDAIVARAWPRDRVILDALPDGVIERADVMVIAKEDWIQLLINIAALRTALRPRQEFFRKCWDAARQGYSLDGGEVQDWGEELGLLVRVVATQACGENCSCAEYTDDWPTDCYRPAPMPDVGGAPERDLNVSGEAPQP